MLSLAFKILAEILFKIENIKMLFVLVSFMGKALFHQLTKV